MILIIVIIRKDEESGLVTTNMFAFHGCEGDLAAALDVQVST